MHLSQDASQVYHLPRRYQAILADPPWPFLQRGRKGAEMHYPLMSLERIRRLPVAELAEDDAFLFLWVTNAALRYGYDVAEAWGFTVRSPITWVKFRMGLGHYARNTSEHLLLATRGKPQVLVHNQPTWMVAPVQAHSEKPAEQFAVIERLAPGPYLELFARRRPPSDKPWFVWGQEVDSDISIPGYPVPSDHGRQR